MKRRRSCFPGFLLLCLLAIMGLVALAVTRSGAGLAVFRRARASA